MGIGAAVASASREENKSRFAHNRVTRTINDKDMKFSCTCTTELDHGEGQEYNTTWHIKSFNGVPVSRYLSKSTHGEVATSKQSVLAWSREPFPTSARDRVCLPCLGKLGPRILWQGKDIRVSSTYTVVQNINGSKVRIHFVWQNWPNVRALFSGIGRFCRGWRKQTSTSSNIHREWTKVC